MQLKKNTIAVVILILAGICTYAKNSTIRFCGSKTNDLYSLLQTNHLKVKLYALPKEAIADASGGDAVIVVSDDYPELSHTNDLNEELLNKASQKGLKLYVEYPGSFPGLKIPAEPLITRLERGIITSDVFGKQLLPMSLLGINDCHILPVVAKNPLIVLGKVVGFKKAEYGLVNTKVYPLLLHQGNVFIALTKLSNFQTARYGPEENIKLIWTYLLSSLTNNQQLQLETWNDDVSPMYAKTAKLPVTARKTAIEKGVDWFYKGHFFVHADWKEQQLKYQDGHNSYNPPLRADQLVGDGTMGIIEGQRARINFDGSQQYNYWLRADVQGEVSMALAASAQLLNKRKYADQSINLIDYTLKTSNMRGGAKNDPKSPAFGLLGWATTAPGVFYGDDNARAMLGIIAASGYLKTDRWNAAILENLLANLRTTGKNGFRDDRLEEADILKLGWKHYQNRDLINPHPHFESWLWACYLWLYQKTGYKPLLETAKNGIKTTMEMYPDKWKWTNGIQQERARMILPLAWLVKVEDTPEHRKWLNQVVDKLLENQDSCGAIREELGSADKGMFGRTKNNDEYGLNEAPLIFANGDPVSDMLYTSNFALFSLNEASHATGDVKYKRAVEKLSDFLTRIQVQSKKHPALDGAWFRAFDYNNWEYWASNADAGWGVWSTLTGWIQSWIITTQVQIQQNQSFWDVTKESTISSHMQEKVKQMLENN